LLLLEVDTIEDKRGTFSRLFCKTELAPIIGSRQILQVNQSKTSAVGTVRGLHFQTPPYCEMKFIQCLKGKVWDVAVDLRAGSKTFLHWYAVELSGLNMKTFVIPEGFAHGYQVLQPDTELLYFHTEYYKPEFESGIHHHDPSLNIDWPVSVSEVSFKDTIQPLLKRDFKGIKL
jgi:dTDP-4-dehydrorhamnose 3,5-epimerase